MKVCPKCRTPYYDDALQVYCTKDRTELVDGPPSGFSSQPDTLVLPDRLSTTPIEDHELAFEREIDRNARFRREHDAWFNSPHGVASAQKELEKLFTAMEQGAKERNERLEAIKFEFRRDGFRRYVISSSGFSLIVEWECNQEDTLKGSRLLVRVFDDKSDPNRLNGQKFMAEYDIDQNRDLGIGWYRRPSKDPFLTTHEVAKANIRILLSTIDRANTDIH